MEKKDPRYIRVHGVCDFCEGYMDNCPYCHGRGRIREVIDTETNKSVEDDSET